MSSTWSLGRQVVDHDRRRHHALKLARRAAFAFAATITMVLIAGTAYVCTLPGVGNAQQQIQALMRATMNAPFRHYVVARQRQLQVLDQLVANQTLSAAAARTAYRQRLPLRRAR